MAEIVPCPLTFEDLKDAVPNSGALNDKAQCYICALYAAQHPKTTVWAPDAAKFPSRGVSVTDLASMSTALMVVTTRHHPSVYFGDRWQCCGAKGMETPGCMQGDFVTSLDNFHHPSGYDVEGDSWDCCCKVGIEASGCQTGSVMHHPTRFTTTVGGTELWSCCHKKQRWASGCAAGPHRSTFDSKLQASRGTGDVLQKNPTL